MGAKENEMDKKTIIGLVLMVAVFIGYTFYMSSEQEKNNEIKAANEKAAKEERENAAEAAMAEQERWENLTAEQKAEEIAQKAERERKAQVDKHGQTLLTRYNQESQIDTVCNGYMTVCFDRVGGKIVSVELEDYKRYEKDVDKENRANVNLINPGSAYFGIDITPGDDTLNTNDYLFDCAINESEDNSTTEVVMTLPLDENGGELKYTYTINNSGNRSEDYLIGFDIAQNGIDDYLEVGDEIILRWKHESMHNEKSFTNENAASTIMFYDREEEESDEIDASGEREHHRGLDWIALKQQYFTSALLAEDVIHAGLGFKAAEKGDDYVKAFDTRIIIPHDGSQNYEFAFYYGPNDYNIMKEVSFAGRENNLEEIIPMGGWLIGWLNRILTIPVFNWLKNNGLGFGLIILILTLIVKLIILPLTYKSYMSTAKMRAIRPEMEEINKKYPNQEDAMKKQQALMELYRKAGVSPMGGCLPLLIQMPILWAMFRFFPASIELRGESFLWADDLSSYDSVLELPFNIPFYGSHVSLFALLMAISLFGYSYISYKQQATTTAGQPGAGVMKFMMVYFMPVMMLFFFNGYSSGLCYYYFLSQMFTMLIMYIIRRSVDDNKVRERLLANASKPKKKSRFQARYEELLKQQQEQLNREQRRQRR